MPPTLADRLHHILQAIDDVERLTSATGEAQFAADRFRRLAVERALEIVSEACRHIPIELRETESSIDWRRMLDFGNVLRHAYHNIDVGIVWTIATQDVPNLKAAVNRLERSAS